MNILLISQCSKKALPETRRVLDQFAERKGDRVWETAITQQGLLTLRKMLRKKARRNTAVACHWIRGKNHSELLWIVGNIRKFNTQGTVPTNTTSRDILRSDDENNWHTAEAISLLAGIAGLFHDFGKANALFQQKLDGTSKKFWEPLRHEWVSLRLFQAFVGDMDDGQWLEKLRHIQPEDEPQVLQGLIKDDAKRKQNPLAAFKDRPLAQVIGWLIVSHHRLPKFNPYVGLEKQAGPTLEKSDRWLSSRNHGMTSDWNSQRFRESSDDWSDEDWQQLWTFPAGTPLRSQRWCDKTSRLAKRALQHHGLTKTQWLNDRFSAHLARLALMLADHSYSAGDATDKWQDPDYDAWANTDRDTREKKQRLDEHNIGVGYNAVWLSKSLPKLRDSLPTISGVKPMKARSKIAKFRWQDQAFDLVRAVAERTRQQGFFGVNMASTGKGKTFANARIMYGLSDERKGCRFNVALGLRTLTLQTGDALRERLKLASDDLGVLIGSQAVQQLHQQQNDTAETEPSPDAIHGSESAEQLYAEHHYVRYDGSLDQGPLSRWIKQSDTVHRLISAPVLVSTIDHLMPATDGDRGGRQIAPMLRLLTSDLVLDEPDDFGLEDLPALCRLVNWAGMLGSRVLLSSATLPPTLIQALFEAYLAGRKIYNQSCGVPQQTHEVCCAWFDEFGKDDLETERPDAFSQQHEKFVQARMKKLAAEQQVLRKAALLPVEPVGTQPDEVIQGLAEAVSDGIYRLHASHHQCDPHTGKQVSIGVVRMANINPMVALAQAVLQQDVRENHRIHFCLYHSQHPLLLRSDMERQLDAALDRHDENDWWQVAAIRHAVDSHPEQHQVFVVFATSVAEVGRDHDYDWAIAEPSSMRSLIQLAGRIQRHRQQVPTSPNLLILRKNYRGLKGDAVAFTRPGFEDKDHPLHSHDLVEVLQTQQFETISATPRIQPRSPLTPRDNLVDLEHEQLQARLFGEPGVSLHAAQWWQRELTWSAELQRRSPFRQSESQEHFVLMLEEEDEPLQFWRFTEQGDCIPAEKQFFQRAELRLGRAMWPWMILDANDLLEKQADLLEMEVKAVSLRFCELRLRKKEPQEAAWCYHPLFGAYEPLVR